MQNNQQNLIKTLENQLEKNVSEGEGLRSE